MKTKLYEYVIFWEPSTKEENEGLKPTILLGPKPLLSNNEKTATMFASRQIPEKYSNNLEQITIAVRPF